MPMDDMVIHVSCGTLRLVCEYRERGRHTCSRASRASVKGWLVGCGVPLLGSLVRPTHRGEYLNGNTSLFPVRPLVASLPGRLGTLMGMWSTSCVGRSRRAASMGDGTSWWESRCLLDCPGSWQSRVCSTSWWECAYTFLV